MGGIVLVEDGVAEISRANSTLLVESRQLAKRLSCKTDQISFQGLGLRLLRDSKIFKSISWLCTSPDEFMLSGVPLKLRSSLFSALPSAGLSSCLKPSDCSSRLEIKQGSFTSLSSAARGALW